MNDKEKLINCIKTNSIIYEQQYKINENICCFCLDTLSGKICYECKNCHKGFCLENNFCKGILEYLKINKKCPICTVLFETSDNIFVNDYNSCDSYELSNILETIYYEMLNNQKIPDL